MQTTRDVEIALRRLQRENRVYVVRIAGCFECWLLAGPMLALLASTPAGGGQTNMCELLLCLLFVVAEFIASLPADMADSLPTVQQLAAQLTAQESDATR